MIKHQRIDQLAALLMAVAVLLISIMYLMPTAFEAITGSAEPLYVSAMDKAKVLDIQIVADQKDWADMLQNATAEEYIAATIVINGTKIENVGIRPKGNSSLSMVAQDDTTDRYSFKIEFDHYVTGQTWLGLDKIVVNNMQGDASYMKEYLSYDIMDYVGVETPRYAFSNITVNGETWGFYLAVETLEDSYAKRVYGNDHGKLYKPEGMGMRGNGQMNERMERTGDGVTDENRAQQENPAGRQMSVAAGGQSPPQAEEQMSEMSPAQLQSQVEGQMPSGEKLTPEVGGGRGGCGGQSGGATLQYTDDELSSYSVIFESAVFDSTDTDYKRVINAIKKLNAGEDLENTVDVEATLQYFAAQTVVVNLDSYVSNMCHNYYLYEKDGRLTMLPWDYNLAFGGFQSGSASSVVNFPIDTPVSGVNLEDRPILAKLLEVPEYMALYHGYLQQIVDGYFSDGQFSRTVDSLDALISSYVESDPTAFYDATAYRSGVTELKKLGELRAQSIEGQLDGRIPATTEGQSANSAALVDASNVNLSALGSMGGGGMSGENQEGNGNVRPDGNMQGLNMENMQRAMEIIQSAGERELTEEQLAELQDLGVTEEQIDMFKSRGQGRFNDGGNRPDNAGRGDASARGNPNNGNMSASTAAGFDTKTWIVLGIAVALLSGGLLFVIFYRRRRMT